MFNLEICLSEVNEGLTGIQTGILRTLWVKARRHMTECTWDQLGSDKFVSYWCADTGRLKYSESLSNNQTQTTYFLNDRCLKNQARPWDTAAMYTRYDAKGNMSAQVKDCYTEKRISASRLPREYQQYLQILGITCKEKANINIITIRTFNKQQLYLALPSLQLLSLSIIVLFTVLFSRRVINTITWKFVQDCCVW